MRRFVFRLSDRASGSFGGIVVIFATRPPDVWRKLVTDAYAQQIRYLVMAKEVAPLARELERLVDGATVGAETPLLRQLFDDPAFGPNQMPRFKGSHTFKVISGTEESFRGWVDHSFREAQRTASDAQAL